MLCFDILTVYIFIQQNILEAIKVLRICPQDSFEPKPLESKPATLAEKSVMLANAAVRR